MKKNILVIGTLYVVGLVFSLWLYDLKPMIIEDVGQLLPTKIKEVRSATSEAELQSWVKESIDNDEKISVAGMQHSQGGHTYYPNGIVIDMKNYDKILDYNPNEKTITVQSGATWEEIQKKINPDHLSIRVMQSQNIFTVGGSISVNAHGRDIRYGSLIDNVESFRLLTPEAKIINVSRTENSKLFPLVIGGYGLFGIILDVTIHLTEDELYQIRSKSIDYQDYPDYFIEHVKENNDIRMHIARLSVAPKTLLRDMYITDYELVENQDNLTNYDKLKEIHLLHLKNSCSDFHATTTRERIFFGNCKTSYMLAKMVTTLLVTMLCVVPVNLWNMTMHIKQKSYKNTLSQLMSLLAI